MSYDRSNNDIALNIKPSWWTAAVYRGGRFVKYTPYFFGKWSDFVKTTDQYGLYDSYHVYPFFWDQGSWQRSLAVSGESGKGQAASVGALERRSPLPPGRYWQDIFAAQAPDWNQWAQEHEANGSLKIVKFEYFRADPLRSGEWLPMALQPDSAGTIPARTWLLFDVLKPADWPATKLGFPTIVTDPASVQSSADTASNPPGPSPLDEVEDAVKGALTPIAWGLGALLGLKLLWELRRR